MEDMDEQKIEQIILISEDLEEAQTKPLMLIVERTQGQQEALPLHRPERIIGDIPHHKIEIPIPRTATRTVHQDLNPIAATDPLEVVAPNQAAIVAAHDRAVAKAAPGQVEPGGKKIRID